jgi:hypothetical protein
VEDIGVGPIDKGVAVGVGMLDMVDADVVAIEVEGDVVGEGDDRQRAGRRRRDDRAPEHLLHRHAAPDIVVGDDHRAGSPDILVPAGMVLVPVGVDDEADRIGIDLAHGGEDALGERRILIVDQHVAVGAVGQADIAAAAEYDRDAGRDPLDADLDGFHRRRLGDDGRRGQSGGGERGSAQRRS